MFKLVQDKHTYISLLDILNVQLFWEFFLHLLNGWVSRKVEGTTACVEVPVKPAVFLMDDQQMESQSFFSHADVLPKFALTQTGLIGCL
ncbi:hypothetical protein CDAR_595151 [Caerostris darwini]|uniref:Uncharacterized protein n=1 Tax=Caerostris darwini TaxID=1538125 RepID=A0AAV4PAN5_9ARAC|nr:hypothetical protein CDAR_595151 [Caerostris darwini]